MRPRVASSRAGLPACLLLALSVATAHAAPPEPAPPGAAFAEGLGAPSALPSPGPLPGAFASVGAARADAELGTLLENARRWDQGEGRALYKAAAWERLAAYSRANPYKAAALARREQWRAVAAAEARRRSEAERACQLHERDRARLARLLGPGGEAHGELQRAAFERAYAPWRGELRRCDEYAAERARAEASAAAAEQERRAAVMVELPAGRFTMSTRGDVVSVASFWLDRTEVTVSAYASCVSAGPCSDPEVGAECNAGRPNRGAHPANCVDWDQATAYCAWLGRRLPTEEEWEWAARGGERGSVYPWGAALPGAQLCWSREGSVAGTCPVAAYPAGRSPEGLADLAGNVWEWTSSVRGAWRVVRGGGWGTRDAAFVRAGARRADLPADGHDSDLGFRCAR